MQIQSLNAPPAGGQLGINKQFKQIAALSWHGLPMDLRKQEILGKMWQYLGNCVLETHRFSSENTDPNRLLYNSHDSYHLAAEDPLLQEGDVCGLLCLVVGFLGKRHYKNLSKPASATIMVLT